MAHCEDKILHSLGEHERGKIMVTNDGATILQKMHIENAASKIIIGTQSGG